MNDDEPYDLSGRWYSNGIAQVTIAQSGSKTAGGIRIRITPINPEIRKWWTVGDGGLFGDKRASILRVTFSGGPGIVTVDGNVAPDGESISWDNGDYWTRPR